MRGTILATFVAMAIAAHGAAKCPERPCMHSSDNSPDVVKCRQWLADFWRENGGNGRPAEECGAPFPIDMPLPWLEKDNYDWFERHNSRVEMARTTNPQIVFIGDSITHCWEANDRRGDAKGVFDRWFGKYSTLNLGFGWDRIQNVLWRLEHGEMDGTNPRVVVIHIGTNNTSPGYKYNAAPNSPGEIADGILAVCKKVRELAPNARIVLMKVFPRGKTPADPYRGKVAAVNAELDRRIAGFHDDRLTVMDMYDKFVDAAGNISLDLTIDYLHPTAKGYDLWGAALAPIVKDECGTARPAPRSELAAAPFLPASAETVRTRYGTAEYVKHVPDSKTQVAAVLYALTGDIRDAARCPVARLNARGYGVVTLDCTKLSGDRGAAWAAAIKAVKAALASDRDIDADAIGVVLDKVEPGWDEDEANWMALADAYDRKGWNADPSKVVRTQPFKVMAWNLEGKSESEKELASLAELLKDVNPDVLLASEIYGRLPRIVSLLGGGWSGERFSMNLAVVSRWPIAKTECPYEAPWNYLDPTGPFNFALAELVVRRQRVRVCPLWLNWEHGTPRFSNPRDEEMSGILASVAGEIREADDVPIVIGGDFNGYGEPHEKMMADAGFADTYRLFHPELDGTNTYTWVRSTKPSDREFIDYIFSKGAKLRPVASETFHATWHQPFEYKGKRYDSYPSDHGFILTTFELELPAPPARRFKAKKGEACCFTAAGNEE